MDSPKPRFELLLGGKASPVVETAKQVQAIVAPAPVPRPTPVKTMAERQAFSKQGWGTAWWTRPEHRSSDGSSRLLQVLRLMADGEWHDAPTLMQSIPGARSFLVKGVERGFLDLDRASGIVKPKLGSPGRPRDRWRINSLGRAFVEVLG